MLTEIVLTLTYGTRRLFKWFFSQWAILIFISTIIAAMWYVSVRQEHVDSLSTKHASLPPAEMLAPPAEVSNTFEATVEKECSLAGVPVAAVARIMEIADKYRGKPNTGIGLTLIKLTTAQEAMHDKSITAAQLEGDTVLNVTASIRYLGQMKHRFDNNIHLAVLAYYRGPTRVQGELDAGINPSTGIEMKILGSRLTFPT